MKLSIVFLTFVDDGIIGWRLFTNQEPVNADVYKQEMAKQKEQPFFHSERINQTSKATL